jgi:siroheme synthase-like protein
METTDVAGYARKKLISKRADLIVANHAAVGFGGDDNEATLVDATGDQSVHDQVWAEAQANGQLVNVMDVIPQCNFHAASIVRQGQLTIAIGTGGAAPALAATLRRRFEKGFGPEYAEFLEYVQALRPIVAERIPTFHRRAEFWYKLIDNNAITLLRNGDRALFEAKVHMLLAIYESEAVEA